MTINQNLGRRLRDYLISQGTKIGVTASTSDITKFEMTYDTKIPIDLQSYFLEVNGTDGDYAYGIIRFWSLSEFRSLKEEVQEKGVSTSLIQSRYVAVNDETSLFVFADYLHESQLYAIQLLPNNQLNPVFLLDGGTPTQITDSFDAFVAQYLTQPESLRLMVD